MSSEPRGETREERRARARDEKATPTAPEREWSGWVVIATPQGWQHVRVLLPESAMEHYRVGEVAAPNTKAIMAAKVQNDMLSDRLVDRRGWERARK